MDKVSMLVDALIIASLIKGSGDFDRVEDVEEEDLTFLIHADLEVPGSWDKNSKTKTPNR